MAILGTFGVVISAKWKQIKDKLKTYIEPIKAKLKTFEKEIKSKDTVFAKIIIAIDEFIVLGSGKRKRENKDNILLHPKKILPKPKEQKTPQQKDILKTKKENSQKYKDINNSIIK